MKAFFPAGYALSLCLAAASVAGCAGLQPPIGAPSTILKSHAVARHSDRARSWVLPEAKTDDLLYVANWRSGEVTIYAYPSGNSVGVLEGFDEPYGLCTDKAGDVFVPDFGNERVVEYAHGGKNPIEILKDNGTPSSCAIDPRTGDLAVPNSCDGPEGSCYPSGTVLIYKHATGIPKQLTDTYSSQMFYCTYDANGDLFVDGIFTISPRSIGFADLPRGSATFKPIALTLPENPQAPGGLQWDEGYLAVTRFDGNRIYRYALNGNRARLEGATRIDGVRNNYGTNQFLIRDASVVAPVLVTKRTSGMVEFFRYPRGGKPLKAITDSLDFPTAATISVAKG